jgi:hypothetical protein
LSIADNATGSPHTAALSGTGAGTGVYLTDGFESGLLSLWSTVGNGAATVQSTTVNSGTKAAALTNTTGGHFQGLSAGLAGGGQASTFSRACFYLAAGLTGTTVLAQGRDVNGNNMWEVDYDAPAKGLDIYFWNGARTRTNAFSPANLVVTAKWYCVEVQANEVTAGHGQVWLNGTSVASVNADLSAANPYSTLYLWNNGATGTANFDDVQVANTQSGPVGAGATP